MFRPSRLFGLRPLPVAFVAAALALLALPASPLAAQDEEPVIDLSGEWVLSVPSPNGAGTRDVVFVQEDGLLTGTIASSRAAGPLEGTVEGDRVEFLAVVAMDTGDFEIYYSARIEDGLLVDGIIDFGDYGQGTFTGKRKDG